MQLGHATCPQTSGDLAIETIRSHLRRRPLVVTATVLRSAGGRYPQGVVPAGLRSVSA